jgi:hypothetical protein
MFLILVERNSLFGGKIFLGLIPFPEGFLFVFLIRKIPLAFGKMSLMVPLVLKNLPIS